MKRGGFKQRLARRLAEETVEAPSAAASSSSHAEPISVPVRRYGKPYKRLETKGIKRGRAASAEPVVEDEEERARKKYRSCIINKYILNKDSAHNIKQEAINAEAAGARGIDDLTRKALMGNAQRSLMRACLKHCDAPEFYEVLCSTRNPKTKTTGHMVEIPVLLPSELLANMVKKDPHLVKSLASQPLDTAGPLLNKYAREFRKNVTRMLAIGFFGDGAPSQKRKTIECLSWNLLHKDNFWKRFLFACIDKEYVCDCGCSGRHTIDALLEVFQWDMMNLKDGGLKCVK